MKEPSGRSETYATAGENRPGQDMFRFPQAAPLLLEPRVASVLPCMTQLTDMYVRLGA